MMKSINPANGKMIAEYPECVALQKYLAGCTFAENLNNREDFFFFLTSFSTFMNKKYTTRYDSYITYTAKIGSVDIVLSYNKAIGQKYITLV